MSRPIDGGETGGVVRAQGHAGRGSVRQTNRIGDTGSRPHASYSLERKHEQQVGAAGNRTGAREGRTGRKKRAVSHFAGAVRRNRDWKCLDVDTGEDLAKTVREYHIPDFSQWKQEEAFGDLMRGLRATKKGA